MQAFSRSGLCKDENRLNILLFLPFECTTAKSPKIGSNLATIFNQMICCTAQWTDAVSLDYLCLHGSDGLHGFVVVWTDGHSAVRWRSQSALPLEQL